MKRKAMAKISLCLSVICLGTAFAFFGMAAAYGKKAENFSHTVTIWSQGAGFDADTIRGIDKDPEREEIFAAWKEIPDSILSAAESGRTYRADVILLYGSSYCVMPYGKIMDKEDTEGCLIGKKTAEELFGSHRVEGQKLIYGNRTLTVRGVTEEPENLLLCEALLTSEAGAGNSSESRNYFAGTGDVFAEPEISFDRISFFAGDVKEGRRIAEDFRNRYGLNADIVRFDFYQNLSWFPDLIPGKWSDFSGWKENLEMHKKQKEQVGRLTKSCLETEYLLCLRERNLCFLFGVFGLAICSVIFVFGIWKPARPTRIRWLQTAVQCRYTASRRQN
ncbi:MAG: ABC transporter permease [Eubacterium sp.]|nr:ABC transporter permease [Eubacterium sp.]